MGEYTINIYYLMVEKAIGWIMHDCAAIFSQAAGK